MKKKLLIVGWVLLFSLLTVGIALGFSASNVDGVWGHIDCSTTSLYFSEYVYDRRGSGTMDLVALEIFNGTSAAVDLSTYSIRLYRTGTANTFNTKTLTGTLAVGDRYVLVNAGYYGSVPAADDSFLDDDDYRTIVLYNGTTIVDVIGRASTPNTTEPSSNTDTTLRRNITVCSGDPIGGNPYNTSQWTSTGTLDFTNLGTYAGYEGATCDNYATGGDRTLGGAVTTVQASWWDQTPLDTDWNQVRYGNVGGTCASTPAFFATQSGMGFDGANSIPSVTGFNEPFLLGKFCHYNNPISATNTFENIDLDITITNIQCEAPILIPDLAVPPDVTFNYNFVLDETPNTAPCTYATNPAGPACADAIFIAQDASPAYFTCMAPGTPPVEVEFTVAVMGFNPLDDQGECPAEYDPTQSMGAFISNEGTSNCACFYGVFTDYVPTAVDLLSFTGTRLADGILLEWQTADEIDNLGFNLYRATSESGTKVKLNVDLIPTNMMPGSLVGGSYSFEDLTATTNETYFYWLEDVDASGTTTMHGPVEVP